MPLYNDRTKMELITFIFNRNEHFFMSHYKYYLLTSLLQTSMRGINHTMAVHFLLLIYIQFLFVANSLF
jgi:hypothetical protein